MMEAFPWLVHENLLQKQEGTYKITVRTEKIMVQ